MNYTLVKGHMKVVFTQLLDGRYHVTQYQFLPQHNNWVPYSGETVTEKKAMDLMVQITRKEYAECQRY